MDFTTWPRVDVRAARPSRLVRQSRISAGLRKQAGDADPARSENHYHFSTKGTLFQFCNIIWCLDSDFTFSSTVPVRCAHPACRRCPRPVNPAAGKRTRCRQSQRRRRSQAPSRDSSRARPGRHRIGRGRCVGGERRLGRAVRADRGRLRHQLRTAQGRAGGRRPGRAVGQGATGRPGPEYRPEVRRGQPGRRAGVGRPRGAGDPDRAESRGPPLQEGQNRKTAKLLTLLVEFDDKANDDFTGVWSRRR